MSCSIGASCVGVPHALRDELNDPPAFCTQAGSVEAPLFAADEKHLATAWSFLPIAVSSLPKQMSGPGAPPVTIWIACAMTALTAAPVASAVRA